MKLRIVDDALGLSGENIQFVKEDFFGLKVGEKVTQIGNGKENGTIRTDKFKYPLLYVGSIICEYSKSEKMFAFKLPYKINDEHIYYLYGSTGLEIYTECILSSITGSSYMRFYKPFFIKTL